MAIQFLLAFWRKLLAFSRLASVKMNPCHSDALSKQQMHWTALEYTHADLCLCLAHTYFAGL